MRFNFYAMILVLLLNQAYATAGDLDIKMVENRSDKISIRYEIEDYSSTPIFIDGKQYTKIELENATPMKSVVGAPELPKVCRSIIIPQGVVMSAKVTASKFYDIPDIDIMPSKGVILRSVDPASVPYSFSDIYTTDQFYPTEPVTLDAPYTLRDKRGQVVRLYPFQYNPVSRVLRVYTEMTVEILNTGKPSLRIAPKTYRAPNSEFERVYKNHFINFTSESRKTAGFSKLDESGDMLIICHDPWLPNIQPLVDHKNALGINTRAVGVSTIGNTAAQIKDYIQSEYDTGNLAFVLLVGDADEVAPGTSPYGGAADPTYSLVDGDDNYPDIFVGRFSAQTAGDVDTQVERTINYETGANSDTDWWWKGSVVCGSPGAQGDDGEYDYEHLDNIRDDLLGYGFSVVDQFYNNSTISTTKAQLTAAFNEGRGIINYADHGAITGWASHHFTNSDVNALTNEGKLPFIFNVSCVVGKFNGHTCFAEAWLRATNGTEPTGAMGTYMSSVDQSWEAPMCAQDEFNDLLVSESYMSFGALCFAASCKAMDEYGESGSGSGGKRFHNWILFGDPSVRVKPTSSSNGEGDTDDGEGDTDDGEGDTDDGEGDTDDGEGDTDDGEGDTDDGEGDTDDGEGDTDDGEGDTDDGEGDTDDGEGDTSGCFISSIT